MVGKSTERLIVEEKFNSLCIISTMRLQVSKVLDVELLRNLGLSRLLDTLELNAFLAVFWVSLFAMCNMRHTE